MPVSIERLIQSLSAIGIVSAAEAEALARSVPPEKQSADADEFARDLVRQGKLTRYQAAAIYQGKADGLVLGNYLILDKLGAGGMGQVFRARHRRMDRVVALKMLPKKALDAPELLARFQREMKAAAKLTHPNIVVAHDADEAGGLHFLVMEYIEGSDLANLVKHQGPLAVRQALDCILQAARGLEHAHAKGIIHRDIKPPNLLLDKDGTLKILDLGLARFSDALANPGAAPGPDLTHTGSIMGTIDYMAPEQAMDSRQADARSDIYSLGCTLHYLLAARPPFGGDTIMKRLTAHQQAAIPALSASRPDVPESVQLVFGRMVAKRPAARYQTMKEVIAAIESCLADAASAPIVASLPPAVPQAMPLPVALPSAASDSGLKDLNSIALPGGARDKPKPRRSLAKTLLTAGTAVALLVAAAVILMRDRSGGQPGQVAQAVDKQPQQDLEPSTPDPSKLAALPALQPVAPGERVAAKTTPAVVPDKPPPAVSPPVVETAEVSASKPVTEKPRPQDMPTAGPQATSTEPVSAAPTAAADGKQPVPANDAQAHAEQLIKEIFKGDYAGAKQPEGKRALAKKLLLQSQQTRDDPVARYVMAREARDLAIEAADPVLAERAIGLLSSDYALDLHEELAAALEVMVAKSHPADANKSIAETATARAEESLAANDLSMAKRLADVALAAARKTKDPAVVKQAVGLSKTVGIAKQQHDAWQKALATLKDTPDDPSANTSAGRYLCFVQGDWDQGLPYLAKGLDGPLKALAAKSSPPPADAAALVELGDAWWEAGDKSRGKDKTDLRAGAAYWYARAEPELTGLEKTKVAKRLKEFGSSGAAPSKLAIKGKTLPETMQLVLAPGVSMVFRLIPAGTFTMGKSGDTGAILPHPVKITRPFYLGVTEVTQGQWLALMGTNPSLGQHDPPHPVENMSWNDCQQLLEQLNRIPAGRDFRFRLPTEAEWEYACRAGTTTTYYFGDDIARLPEFCWYVDNAEKTTRPVAQLKPNAWGLYDMLGNVWEWCSDWHDGDYYRRSPLDDPLGPATGTRRILRGSSVANKSDTCSSYERNFIAPDKASGYYGLRVVCQTSVDATAEKAVASQSAPRGPKHRTILGPQPPDEFIELPLAPNAIVKLRLIPAGTFKMGTPPDEPGMLPSEDQHEVKLSKPFYLAVTETTQAQWLAVMGNNPSHFQGDLNRPVEQVTWDETQQFVTTLNQSPLGQIYRFRLPTEAEWEYACRAGTKTKFYYGPDAAQLAQYGWFKDNSGATTHAVAQLKPNAWGLYDMPGNVREWCADWFDTEYYRISPPADPKGPETGTDHVNRGGTFQSADYQLRSADRRREPVHVRHLALGFRVACEPVAGFRLRP